MTANDATLSARMSRLPKIQLSAMALGSHVVTISNGLPIKISPARKYLAAMMLLLSCV
jgi:hypothetical protein